MNKSKMLMPLFALCMVGCDNPKDKDVPTLPVGDVLLIDDEKQVLVEGHDFVSEEGLDIDELIINDQDEKASQLHKDKDYVIAPYDDQFFQDKEFYDFLRQLELAEAEKSSLKYSSVSIMDTDDNLYEIAVSKEAEAFEIQINAKKIIDSKDLSPSKLNDLRPIMLDILKDINQMAKDEEELALIAPRRSLGRIVKADVNRHVIKRSRLNGRVEKAQDRIIENTQKAIHIYKNQNSLDNEDVLPAQKTTSEVQRKISHNRWLQKSYVSRQKD